MFKYKGTYVIGVLDCCRTSLIKEKYNKSPLELKDEIGTNLIICYRSASNGKSPANNEFSQKLAELLRLKEENGRVSFLEAFHYS